MTQVWQRHIEEIPTQKTAFRGKDMWQDFWRRPLAAIRADGSAIIDVGHMA